MRLISVSEAEGATDWIRRPCDGSCVSVELSEKHYSTFALQSGEITDIIFNMVLVMISLIIQRELLAMCLCVGTYPKGGGRASGATKAGTGGAFVFL